MEATTSFDQSKYVVNIKRKDRLVHLKKFNPEIICVIWIIEVDNLLGLVSVSVLKMVLAIFS